MVPPYNPHNPPGIPDDHAVYVIIVQSVLLGTQPDLVAKKRSGSHTRTITYIQQPWNSDQRFFIGWFTNQKCLSRRLSSAKTPLHISQLFSTAPPAHHIRPTAPCLEPIPLRQRTESDVASSTSKFHILTRLKSMSSMFSSQLPRLSPASVSPTLERNGIDSAQV